MKSGGRLIAFILSLAIGFSPWAVRPVRADEGQKGAERTWNFDDAILGQLPTGWKVEGTRQRGHLATWQVVADESAPSGKNVLALTSPNHDSEGTFNLCFTHEVSFLDGEIQVLFRANTGKIDQGGGVIWRVQDKDNYYIARVNPLEDNFRIYYVKDGTRDLLASAATRLTAGGWHLLKITHRGHTIAGYLNGQKRLEVTDHTLTKPGGVGLWTKADAATSFDDLTVSVQ